MYGLVVRVCEDFSDGKIGTQPAESNNLQHTWCCKLLDSATCIPMQLVGFRLTHLYYVDLLIRITLVPCGKDLHSVPGSSKSISNSVSKILAPENLRSRSFGVRSGSARGPREVRSGSVRGPFEGRTGSVWGPKPPQPKKKSQPGGVPPPPNVPIPVPIFRSQNFLEPKFQKRR